MSTRYAADTSVSVERSKVDVRRTLPNALAKRPIVGGIVVPYMVDSTRDPIDFKVVDANAVSRCARERRCGVCGKRMDGRYAFIGPIRELNCFGDPWMHVSCARYVMRACPFASGRRQQYRDPGAKDEPWLAPHLQNPYGLFIAESGSAHEVLGAWHFEPKRLMVVPERSP